MFSYLACELIHAENVEKNFKFHKAVQSVDSQIIFIANIAYTLMNNIIMHVRNMQ
jgi:hypothetical protein